MKALLIVISSTLLCLLYYFNSETNITKEDECRASGVHSIEVPLSYNDTEEGTMKLSYQLYKSPNSNAPTIVYLPGGPGENGIGFLQNAPKGFTDYWLSKFNIVATELRGAHCNSVPDKAPEDIFNPQFLVKDMLGVISSLVEKHGMKTYMIYGHSYGTALATLVGGSLNQQDKLPKPRLMLLEGVLGRSFRSSDEVYQAYEAGFQSILSSLKSKNPAIYKAFMTEDRPLGIGPEQWGTWLSTQQMYGPELVENTFVDSVLYGLSKKQIDKTKNIIIKKKIQTVSPLYRYVACVQISSFQAGLDGKDMILQKGKLVRADGSICSDIPESLYDKYDSAKIDLRNTPIVYLQGTQDQATPPWQARYHYNHHNGPKLMVNIHGAGHVLSRQLLDCFPDIFSEVFKAGEEVGKIAHAEYQNTVFSSCRWSQSEDHKKLLKHTTQQISFGITNIK